MRAFTIIEIMLAIAIFSMVIAAIYSSWSAILRAARVGGDAATAMQRSRIAARTLQDALACAVMFTGNARFYSFEADTSGDFAALSFVARLPPSFPGSGYFGDLVVRRVTFVVEAADDGVNQLVLKQMPLLQTNTFEGQAHAIVLAREVNLFGLNFWDARANDWTDQWAQTNQLPKMVRFALAFGKPPERQLRPEDVTMRQVLLASSAVQADWQTRRGVGPGAPPGGAPGTIPQPGVLNTAPGGPTPERVGGPRSGGDRRFLDSPFRRGGRP